MTRFVLSSLSINESNALYLKLNPLKPLTVRSFDINQYQEVTNIRDISTCKTFFTANNI